MRANYVLGARAGGSVKPQPVARCCGRKMVPGTDWDGRTVLQCETCRALRYVLRVQAPPDPVELEQLEGQRQRNLARHRKSRTKLRAERGR